MEYRPVDELRAVASVRPAETQVLTRRERLERWAELLERDPGRRLRSLGEIEWKSPAERREMRAPDSPLTVAYEDPVLRAAGLRSDKLGDGMDFFELTDRDAHNLMCSCMHGWSMSSGTVARAVHRIMDPQSRIATGTTIAAGVVLAVPVLAWLIG